MKKLIALLLATLSISAAATEYQVATNKYKEIIIFSDLPCPFEEVPSLNDVKIITSNNIIFACYGVLEKEIVFFFENGNFVQVPLEEIHFMKPVGILNEFI